MANLIETVGMPLLFVLIWSTGFIVAKFGLPYAPPLTFLLLRYVGVLLLLIPALIIVRAPWPHGSMRHIAVAGVLVQAGYLSGVWCAIKLGMPAGLSALIVGLQPLLTALSAGLIGEPVRRHQWIGFLLGLAGVALVLFNKLSFAGVTLETVSLCLMGLLSITAGTLYQKRFCARFDLRAGATIQFAASLAITLPFAWWLASCEFGEPSPSRVFDLALANAGDDTSETQQQADNIDYETQIKPIFAKHCIDCHKAEKNESGYQVDIATAAIKGGDRGAAVVPGKSDASLLLHVVDASNDNYLEQMDEVHKVLAEIGADNVPQVLVFNKLDAMSDDKKPLQMQDIFSIDGVDTPRLFVSAQTGEGVPSLRAYLSQNLAKTATFA